MTESKSKNKISLVHNFSDSKNTNRNEAVILKNTILFDLDGTLLPIDTEKFINEYFDLISEKVAHIIKPSIFLDHLLYSVKMMILNVDPDKTNEEVFWQHFYSRLDDLKEQITPLVEEFYERDFKKLGDNIEVDGTAAEIIETAKTKNYRLVLATNAIFPRQAILDRIRWAAVNPEDFKLITSYENMHFCKPHLEYYREILMKINEKPENCIMVGNDLEEDIIASKLGIQTFLVNNYSTNNEKTDLSPDFKGPLEDLLSLI